MAEPAPLFDIEDDEAEERALRDRESGVGVRTIDEIFAEARDIAKARGLPHG